MKEGCHSLDLDLQLSSPSATASSGQSSDFRDPTVPNYQFAKDNEFALSTELSMRPPVSACDASELQARVILWLARREMEDKLNQKTGKPSMQVRLIHGPYDGMSLKKSLRVFLQKRRDRIQSCLLYKQRMMNDGNLNDSKIGDK